MEDAKERGEEIVFSLEYSQLAHFRKAAFLRLWRGVEFIKLGGDMTIIILPKTNKHMNIHRFDYQEALEKWVKFFKRLSEICFPWANLNALVSVLCKLFHNRYV